MDRSFTYHCSFCGKHQVEVERLIAGMGGVYICDECVALCMETITERRAARAAAEADPKERQQQGR